MSETVDSRVRAKFRHRPGGAPPGLPVPRRDLRRRSGLREHRGMVARHPRGDPAAEGPALLPPLRRERGQRVHRLRVGAEPRCPTRPASRCGTRRSSDVLERERRRLATGSGPAARTERAAANRGERRTPGAAPPASDARAAARRVRRGAPAGAGGSAGGAALLETLAQLLAALLELLLQLLLLILEHLRVDRRAVESLAEPGERNREGDLAADLVLDADVDRSCPSSSR